MWEDYDEELRYDIQERDIRLHEMNRQLDVLEFDRRMEEMHRYMLEEQIEDYNENFY